MSDETPPSRETELVAAVIAANAAPRERTVALGGMLMCFGGLLMAIYTTFAAPTQRSAVLVVVAAGGVLYFFVARQLLRRARWVDVVAVVSPVVELIIPTLVTVVLIETRGGAYALGSWVPPILFSWVCIQNTARLRPWVAAALGVGAGLSWVGIAFVLVPWIDPTPLPDNEVFSTQMQLARGVNLGIVGVLSAGITIVIRRAFQRGVADVRARDLFGKYRLGDEIATGGMGTVFAATYCPEGGFERPVVIKRIHDHLAHDQEFVDAFRREAELGARLQHRNIVQTLDFGRFNNTYFLTMEFVDGVDLGRLLRSGGTERMLSTAATAYIGAQLCEALHYAHHEARASDGGPLRVVHRDITPRNIMISRRGDVKLTDFGIARALQNQARYRTGRLMGSLAYLAPEQVEGRAHDERVDFFALSATLWEVLVGEQLFARDNDMATLRAIREATLPSFTALRPDAPEPWSAFFRRGLERDPAHRFEDANEMREALLELLALEPPFSAELLGQTVADLLMDPTSPMRPPRARPKDTEDDPEVRSSDLHDMTTRIFADPVTSGSVASGSLPAGSTSSGEE